MDISYIWSPIVFRLQLVAYGGDLVIQSDLLDDYHVRHSLEIHVSKAEKIDGNRYDRVFVMI